MSFPSIHFEQVCKSFAEKKVLSSVSFHITAPGIYAIQGASGMGKTTLLRLIAGLEKADEGSITGYLKDEVAYVFQEPRLLPHATVLQNLLCVMPTKKESKVKAIALLNEVGLGEEANKRPQTLSGGMQTRLSFARAFITDRPILLLDEPFNGLDVNTKTHLIDLLLQQSKEKILILVSHHSEELLALDAKTIYTFEKSWNIS